MSMEYGDIDLYPECGLWGAAWGKAGSRILGRNKTRETNSRKRL